MKIQSSIQHTDMSQMRQNAYISGIQNSTGQSGKTGHTPEKTERAAPLNESRGTQIDILV
ncbi:MAG: hypothetical protein ACLFP8_00720 [Alphaproteobacteria bacterium]